MATATDIYKKAAIQLTKAFLAFVEEISASIDGLFKIQLTELVTTVSQPIMIATGKK